MKVYWYNGKKNVIGGNVRRLRKALRPTVNQQALASKLQLMGYEIDRLTVSRIETGSRYVSDYEVMGLARALEVEIAELYRDVEAIADQQGSDVPGQEDG